MTAGQTVILNSEASRATARRLADIAPPGSVLTVKPPGRTISQNDKMHAMLSDISRAKPDGRMETPDIWKALMMAACGHEVQFKLGIDGNPFPIGFKSSRLSKSQMSELIEFMYEFGSRHNIQWTDEERHD